MSTTLHKYYKKQYEGLLILVQLDPTSLTGVELIINEEGQIVRNERKFDQDIYEDLAFDEFETASPLEFHLYLKGVAGPGGK